MMHRTFTPNRGPAFVLDNIFNMIKTLFVASKHKHKKNALFIFHVYMIGSFEILKVFLVTSINKMNRHDKVTLRSI